MIKETHQVIIMFFFVSSTKSYNCR